MSAAVDRWPALSFLEGLRPGPDESVELALLASCSADLGSIGATLLALAGKDTDAGRGSPSDFADAVERLRRKVRIVIQRGRLAKMRRTPRIAAVLAPRRSIPCEPRSPSSKCLIRTELVHLPVRKLTRSISRGEEESRQTETETFDEPSRPAECIGRYAAYARRRRCSLLVREGHQQLGEIIGSPQLAPAPLSWHSASSAGGAACQQDSHAPT